MRCIKSSLTLLAISFLALLPAAHAQVNEQAIGSGPHAWAGVEFSNFKPDYGRPRLDGIGLFADYLVNHRFGAEAEIRLLDLNRPAGETEKTFLGGLIVNVYTYHRLNAFVKGLAGIGTVNYPNGIGYGSYFAYGVGGGGEYRLNSRFKVRAEYEREGFPSAPGYVFTAPNPSNGLTPTGYSAGVAYRFY